MAVKGPRLHHMVVVPEKPGRQWRVLLLVLLLLAAVAVVAFLAGRIHAVRALAGEGGGDTGTIASLEHLLEQNASLRDELSVYRGSGDMTREVEERVRVENLQLQDRIAELEKALADYRRTVLADRAGKGLRIERLEVANTGSPQTLLLRLVLVRTGDTDSALEGTLDGALTVDGAAGRVVWPLAQLLAVEDRRFRVRYVDERMFELRLPEAATPVRLDLVAGVTAPRPDRIEKSWQRQGIKPQGVPGNAGQQQE
ncbi:MAG: DUF6776 family protein [Pseudomonadota bacterium]